MSRCRKVSTEISLNEGINATDDFTTLLYTWMIPHAEDDGIVHGSLTKIKYMVMPMRKDATPERIGESLQKLHDLDLIYWDQDGNKVYFPPKVFYKYQSYVGKEKRRTSQPSRGLVIIAENSEEQREVTENAVSPSPSLSLSPSPSTTPTPPTLTAAPRRRGKKANNDDDEDLVEAVEFAQKNLGHLGYLRPLELDEIRKWRAQGLDAECIKYAITQAIKNNAPKFSYIGKICDGWIAAGVKTMDDVRTLEQDRLSRRPRSRDRPYAWEESVTVRTERLSDEDKQRMAGLRRELKDKFDLDKAVSSR